MPDTPWSPRPGCWGGGGGGGSWLAPAGTLIHTSVPPARIDQVDASVNVGASPPRLPDEHQQAESPQAHTRGAGENRELYKLLKAQRRVICVPSDLISSFLLEESLWLHPHHSAHLMSSSRMSDTIRCLPNSHLLPFPI